MFTFARFIRDAEHFTAYLKAGGFNVGGVATQDGQVTIFPAPGESGDPTALVDAYANRDYYVITASKPQVGERVGGDPVFECKRDGVDSCTFTITKRRGIDGTVKPDADVVNVHWHGTKAITVSATSVTLNVGHATFTVGGVYMPGGGFVEAVHPTEAVHRGTAYLMFVL